MASTARDVYNQENQYYRLVKQASVPGNQH